MRQVCRVCGDIRTVVIDALVCEHEEVEVKNVFPSSKPCTIQGEREVECLECHKIFTEKLPLEDHKNSKIAVGSGSPVNYVEKCEKDGLEEVVCDYCNQIFERVVPAHNFVTEKTEPATCEKAAVVTKKCSNCGTTKTEIEGEPAKHVYDEKDEDLYVVVEPTCTKPGSITAICVNCGKTKKTETKATGHKKSDTPTYVYLDKDGEIVIDTSEYVTENGSIKLDENGDPVLEDDMDGYKDLSVQYKAGVRNCEYDIAELYDCANDGCETKIMNVVAKAIGGHEIDTTVNVQEGVIAYNPAIDEEPTITVAANGKVTFLKDQTVDCTHAKIRVYKCANTDCSDDDGYIVTIIEQPKHTPNKAGVHNYPATCTTDEYNQFYCDGCQSYVQEYTGVKAKGHDITLVPATCAEGETLACRRCNATSEVLEASKEGLAFIAKLDGGKLNETPNGHSFTDNVSTTTYNEDETVKTVKIKCGSCKEEIVITVATPENVEAGAETTFTYKNEAEETVTWDAVLTRVVTTGSGDTAKTTYEVKGVKLHETAAPSDKD